LGWINANFLYVLTIIVYPGQQATEVGGQLLQDPKGVEKYMAQFLPGMILAGTQA
jgi:hypothetical protein